MGQPLRHISGGRLHFQEGVTAHLIISCGPLAIRAELECRLKSHFFLVEILRFWIIFDGDAHDQQLEPIISALLLRGGPLHEERADSNSDEKKHSRTQVKLQSSHGIPP